MKKNEVINKTKPATRTHTEIAILFKANYGRNFFQGSLHNISLTGAFLFSGMINNGTQKNPSKEINDIKHLSLYIKLNKRSRKLLAKVVWKTKQGYGLQFIKTSVQDKQLVSDLIYFEKEKNKTKQNILHNIFKKVA